MNSFRAVYNALQFEVERQTRELDAGKRIPQETRGWIEGEGVTVSQRSKEEAHDYRYFPEPDLPPVTLSAGGRRARSARSCPSCPTPSCARFEREYGLAAYEANLLTETRARADYYEEAVAPAPRQHADEAAPRRQAQVANWMLGDFARLLHANGHRDQRHRRSRRTDLYAMISARYERDDHGHDRQDRLRADVRHPARRRRPSSRNSGSKQISGAGRDQRHRRRSDRAKPEGRGGLQGRASRRLSSSSSDRRCERRAVAPTRTHSTEIASRRSWRRS